MKLGQKLERPSWKGTLREVVRTSFGKITAFVKEHPCVFKSDLLLTLDQEKLGLQRKVIANRKDQLTGEYFKS